MQTDVGQSFMISKAIEFAARSHAGQVDKRGEPYIYHCLRVMENTKALTPQDYSHRQAAELVIAAVLHDVVEDQGADLEYLKQEFGETVSRIVDAVSRREGETYSEYIDRLMAAEIPGPRIIKLADLQDNIRADRYHPDAPYSRMLKTLERLRQGS